MHTRLYNQSLLLNFIIKRIQRKNTKISFLTHRTDKLRKHLRLIHCENLMRRFTSEEKSNGSEMDFGIWASDI